ncbi:MAG: hypothetical protein AAF471_08755 [Myxococcota bacterium]
MLGTVIEEKTRQTAGRDATDAGQENGAATSAIPAARTTDTAAGIGRRKRRRASRSPVDGHGGGQTAYRRRRERPQRRQRERL